MNYCVMLKNKCICQFELADMALVGMNPALCSFNIADLPLYKTFISPDTSINGLYNWLAARRPARSRANLFEAMHLAGIASFKLLLDITKLLSVTDALWVKAADDSKSTWENVNLYNNPLNEVLQKLAFSGQGCQGIRIRSHSPEWLTDGCLPKCWKRLDNKLYLCKGSLNPTHKYPHEPYMEVFASQLAHHCGINCVPYSLGRVHSTLVSKCPIFTSADVGYLRIADVREWSDASCFEEIVAYYTQNRWLDAFVSMMALDALILNIDRHLGNFGVLRNNDTGTVLRPAPVFDNGAGLKSTMPAIDSVSEARDIARSPEYFSAFDIPFSEILKVLNKTSSKQLKWILLRAKTFRYIQSERFPLDKGTVVKWEKAVHYLADYYLVCISKVR